MLSAVVFGTLADVFSTPGGVKPGVWKLSVSLARYSELTWRQLAKLEEPCCVCASFGFSFGHTACISCLSVQVLLSLKCACVFSESLTHKRLLQCAMMEVIIKKRMQEHLHHLKKEKKRKMMWVVSGGGRIGSLVKWTHTCGVLSFFIFINVFCEGHFLNFSQG